VEINREARHFMNAPKVEPLRQVIAAEQIQKRVKELARQISDDYEGQTIQALAVLENAFMFMADLVRALEVPVVCQFIKPKYSKQQGDTGREMCGDIFQPRAGYSRAAYSAGRRPGAFRGDQRVSDERSAGAGGGFGEAGDAAGPAIGAARGLAAGLFWLSGG
jgi:hypothetical protein